MQRTFWHPLFVTLVLAISGIIIILGPYEELVRLASMEMTVFYANGVVAFMASLVATVYATQRMGKTVVTAVSIGIANVVASIWGLWFGVILGAQMPTIIELILVIGFNLTFGLLGEVIFSTFLVSRILNDIRSPRDKAALATFLADTDGRLALHSRSTTPAPPRPPTFSKVEVEILGMRFVVDQIAHLQAEEHYVRIILRDGQSHLLRGKISDAVAAMSAVAGRRIHRSHWVAASAVTALRAERSGHVIMTSSGKELPVARTRQAEIKVWAEAILRGSKEKAPAKGA